MKAKKKNGFFTGSYKNSLCLFSTSGNCKLVFELVCIITYNPLPQNGDILHPRRKSPLKT